MNRFVTAMGVVVIVVLFSSLLQMRTLLNESQQNTEQVLSLAAEMQESLQQSRQLIDREIRKVEEAEASLSLANQQTEQAIQRATRALATAERCADLLEQVFGIGPVSISIRQST